MFKLILIQYSSVVTRRIILIKSGKIIKCGCNWSKRIASNINIFLSAQSLWLDWCELQAERRR